MVNYHRHCYNILWWYIGLEPNPSKLVVPLEYTASMLKEDTATTARYLWLILNDLGFPEKEPTQTLIDIDHNFIGVKFENRFSN